MKQTQAETPAKPVRKFLPDNLVIDSWAGISSFYEDLKNRVILSASDLKQWLNDLSELNSVLSEDAGWRYIRSSCDTNDLVAKKAFDFFIQEIQPRLAPYENELNLKFLNSPFLHEFLDSVNPETAEAYRIYLRIIEKQVEIYRDANIPVFTELRTEEQNYSTIAGEMTIEKNGEEITLQQAANFLKDNRRDVREEVYLKINQRRAKDRTVLDELFTKLVRLRHQAAAHADFKNYRDYMFASLGRFDYTAEDCFDFHSSISKEIVPLVEKFEADRKIALHLDTLKPWDLDVDTSGKEPLKPFSGGTDLIEKTIQCFTDINPFLGNCISTMRSMNRVDLESRKGKAPGGYNYPLYETGVPFVFMNSANSLRDVITMVHEGGHAVHSFLTHPLEFVGFKDTPSEVSEFASMSMELISMEHWNVFFPDKDELKRAKLHQLEKVISVLPWIATIDKFQHWVYTYPNHTTEERTKAWREISDSFEGTIVDYNGQQEFLDFAWQKQLHLYQVPFYYIEYGMAQLGAIAMWRNYKANPEKGLNQYLDALRLGYTKSIGEIYKTAGVRFDFSQSYIRELAHFVKEQIELIS